MKILIDTNIFFDFYRSNNQTLNIFNELINHSDKIIITDQIIQEFDRSRESVIKKVKDNFQKESKLESFSSSYLQNLAEFNELIDIQKAYKLKLKEVNAKIEEILNDSTKDPIATFFKEFVNESMANNRVLFTTDEILRKANERKLKGNPPVSDKYSIGDEINWEIVISNIKEDIIIVGRDNTFNNNMTFLKKDFHKNTGHFIIGLTESITKALQKAGIETSPELIEEENKFIEEIKHFNEFWKHVTL